MIKTLCLWKLTKAFCGARKVSKFRRFKKLTNSRRLLWTTICSTSQNDYLHDEKLTLHDFKRLDNNHQNGNFLSFTNFQFNVYQRDKRVAFRKKVISKNWFNFMSFRHRRFASRHDHGIRQDDDEREQRVVQGHGRVPCLRSRFHLSCGGTSSNDLCCN